MALLSFCRLTGRGSSRKVKIHGRIYLVTAMARCSANVSVLFAGQSALCCDNQSVASRLKFCHGDTTSAIGSGIQP